MGRVKPGGLILLIDNNEDEAMRFFVGLEELGWGVELAQDVAGAVETAKALKPSALVLRAQAEFPDGHAMQAHKALKVALGTLPPVILLTSRTPDEERSAWQGAGLAGVIEGVSPCIDLHEAILAVP